MSKDETADLRWCVSALQDNNKSLTTDQQNKMVQLYTKQMIYNEMYGKKRFLGQIRNIFKSFTGSR